MGSLGRKVGGGETETTNTRVKSWKDLREKKSPLFRQCAGFLFPEGGLYVHQLPIQFFVVQEGIERRETET